jgi:hypothetical protein
MMNRIRAKTSIIMFLILLIVLVLGIAAFALTFWPRVADLPENELTALQGHELEDALNFYFFTLESEAAFEQPQIYCQQVAIGSELSRCITTQSIRAFHDTRKVVRLRVIDYQSDCAVAMAVYSTVGSTAARSFLFKKEDAAWKIADLAEATGEFNQPHPRIPFGCN